jgi:molecular chaperone DnaJ
MPKLRSTGRVDGRGDLHVHLEVVVPTKLDAAQTSLLRDLAELRGENEPSLSHNGKGGGGLFSRLRASRGHR